MKFILKFLIEEFVNSTLHREKLVSAVLTVPTGTVDVEAVAKTIVYYLLMTVKLILKFLVGEFLKSTLQR